MASILGRNHFTRRLRRLQSRTRGERVALYEAGASDGRGGQTAPVRTAGDVEAAAAPIPVEDATEFLAERLVHRDPHHFFFAHNETLPDDCYVLYEGTLYEEENRVNNDVTLRVTAVRAQDQSTA